MTSIGSNPSFFPPMKPVDGGGCGAHGGGDMGAPDPAALPELINRANVLVSANGGGGFSGVLGASGAGASATELLGVDGAAPTDPDGNLIGASPGGGLERFVRSQAGGLLLDKAGEPAGRVPENSVFDAKSGKVFGPDGAPIALPDGGSVDFFDLGDVNRIRQDFAAFLPAAPAAMAAIHNGALAGGGAAEALPMFDPLGRPVNWGSDAPMKAPAKGGGAVGGMHGDAGCDMDMPGGSAAAHGAMGTHARGGGSTVAGMFGSGVPAKGGGGLVGGVNGSGMLGTTPGLESSLASLIATLQQLAMAISGRAAMGGGAPGQLPIQGPGQVLGARGPGQKGGGANSAGDITVGIDTSTLDLGAPSADDSAAAAAAGGDESLAAAAGGGKGAKPAVTTPASHSRSGSEPASA